MRQKKTEYRQSGPAFAVFAALLALFLSSFTQGPQRNRRGKTAIESQYVAPVKDTAKPVMSDSLLAVIDSTHRADSVFRADSILLLKSSSLKHPAFSTARDSLVEDFTPGHRKAYYYGDVTVTYDDMKLTADYMEYDLETGTVYARGTTDSTGTTKGAPRMEQGGKSYSMEELRYNFNSKKARITNMITQEADGLLHGKNIKMLPDMSVNITKGKYTVCDLEHPHYYLHLTAAKVITRPSQKTVFGPAYPVIEDIPLPIGVPFGFIPKRPNRATGMLMPTFGEETSRGFYLKDLGMYFVFGDYLDLSVTGDIFTLGSWALDINSRYKVNYRFNGNFAINYSNDQTGEKGSADFFQTRNFGVRWSHSMDPKAHPGTSFTASVNFSSPSNSRYNSRSVTEALQNQVSSSISYSRNWNGKFSLSVNALHNQNSRDSSYAFTLPNVTFSVTRFYPFKRKNRVGKERFYEKFSLGYNTTLQNKISFKVSDLKDYVLDGGGNFITDPATGFRRKEYGDSLMTKLVDRMQNGMNHAFSIGLPNFTLAKYFNFTPSVSYGMNWFFSSIEKRYNPETNRVEDIPSGQFSTFGATHNYSGSLAMSTRLYGMFNFGRFHKIQAIRHVISPSVSLNLSPEKGKAFNGWRTYRYVDRDGVERSLDYNIYQGQLNSPPGKGKTASMSFSLGNNLEAKVRDLRDTTGKGVKKVKLIDQLNLSGSYNFLADSLRMSNIGVTMSTSVFGKVGLSANANFDPYAIDGQGRRINQFNFSKMGWKQPLRLTNASASLSYSLSGKGALAGNDGTDGGSQGSASDYTRIYYHPVTGEYIPGGWLFYMNPNVPWSLNINYSFNYARSYQYSNNKLVTNNRFTQTVGLSGNVKLTPRMSINATTGFDLMAMAVTTTQLSATYDLHCFNIAVSWVPTGTWQSWSFRIAANAAALADLLRFKKSSSMWDRY